MNVSRATAWFLVIAAAGAIPSRPSVADEGTSARSVDAVAKERADEYEELRKKGTEKAADDRRKILDGLAFAPCGTARRFLLGIVKKGSAPGDERLAALKSLLHMVETSTLEDVIAVLVREKDETLWQAFGEALPGARSDVVGDWLRGPALAARDAHLLRAALDAHARRRDAAAAETYAALFSKHAKPTGSVDVAAQALRTLVAAKGAAARPTLLEAGRNADARIRLVVADVLPGLEPFDAEAEAAVRGLLQDESATVRQVATIRAGQARRASLAATWIPMLADPRARTRHVVSVALETATGQKLGKDAKAWAAWLEKKDPGKAETVTVPTYHGVSVESDRVVFLVDASSSMTWPWRRPTKRIDVARAELAAVLSRLAPDVQFNVATFSDEVAWFRKAESPATPENVAAAVAWAAKALADPKGDTHLYEALDAAFSTDPQFDTIFLLTDGNPTQGRYHGHEGLLASVRAWNRHRRAAIHTIGLTLASEDPGMPNLSENPQVMAELLGAFARETHGEYREVKNAPAAK